MVKSENGPNIYIQKGSSLHYYFQCFIMKNFKQKILKKNCVLLYTDHLDSTIDNILTYLKVSCQYPDTSSLIDYASAIYNSKVLEKPSTQLQKKKMLYRL